MSPVVGRPCTRACVRAGVTRRAANRNAAEAPCRTRRQCKEVGDRASGVWVGPGHRSYAVESAMTCSVHYPPAGGARFTGRTDPLLSWGADYASSANYARRGQLVIMGGELRRPTSSRCTDGDATTAPIPRMPKSPFRLAASRPIRAYRIPGQRSASAAATCPALRSPTYFSSLAHGQAQHEQPPFVPEPAAAYVQSRTTQRPVWLAVTFPRPGLAEGPLPLQRGHVKGAPRPLLSTPDSLNLRLAHGPVRCLCSGPECKIHTQTRTRRRGTW